MKIIENWGIISNFLGKQISVKIQFLMKLFFDSNLCRPKTGNNFDQYEQFDQFVRFDQFNQFGQIQPNSNT